MKHAVLILLAVAGFFAPARGLFAQAPGTQPEISKSLLALADNAERLMPMLQQIKPEDWVAKGASDTYVSQWKTSEQQCKALATDARTLAQSPDKLTEVLKVLFRVQFLELSMGSLEEGLRKYQNPALAELLNGTSAENIPYREKLQQFAIDLADQREQDYKVADAEAQRCRNQLVTKPRPGK
jgi:hypothetical protein